MSHRRPWTIITASLTEAVTGGGKLLVSEVILLSAYFFCMSALARKFSRTHQIRCSWFWKVLYYMRQVQQRSATPASVAAPGPLSPFAMAPASILPPESPSAAPGNAQPSLSPFALAQVWHACGPACCVTRGQAERSCMCAMLLNHDVKPSVQGGPPA